MLEGEILQIPSRFFSQDTLKQVLCCREYHLANQYKRDDNNYKIKLRQILSRKYDVDKVLDELRNGKLADRDDQSAYRQKK
ncbi:hypothetical protein D3C81_1625920 [compost metagenome]